MTKNELLAQAEALEQSRCVQAQDTAAELRTQAAASEAPIPIVDGSKPYYVEIDGVRRKYLPGAVEALEAPEPIGWVHPAYLPGNGLSGALTMDVSPTRLSQQQVPLYLAPVDQSKRIAEYRKLLDLACRQAECEMLLTGDEIRRIRAALEKP